MPNAYFKKYSKTFMAIFGSLLMLTFVIGGRGNFGGFGGSSNNPVRGTLKGKNVTKADIDRATLALQCSEAFQQSVGDLSNAPSYQVDVRQDFQISDNLLDPASGSKALSLYLILTEAQQYGVRVTDSEVLGYISLAGNQKFTEEKYRDLLERLGMSQVQFRRALADALTPNKMRKFISRGVIPSVPELNHDAIDYRSTADVRLVALAASDAGSLLTVPTEEQIQHQFDLYKDRIPGTRVVEEAAIDGHHYPFGYKYPDRIELDWVKIPRDAVRATIPITAADQVAALRRFQQNPDAWKPAATAGTQPASQPAVTFESVRLQVTRAILDEKTDAKMKEISDAARAYLARGAGGTATQPGLVSYQSLADDIRREFDVQLTVGRVDHPTGEGELSREPALRTAFVGLEGQAYPLVAYLYQLKEFAATPNTRALLPINRDGPLAQDEAGNLLLYRVTSAEPSHSPASLADVREAVIRDLRRLKEYQANQVAGRQLAERVSRDGATALISAAAERQTQVQVAKDVKRMEFTARGFAPGTINPEIGRLAPLTEGIFSIAEASVRPEQIWPSTLNSVNPTVTPAATGPAATAPATSAPAVENAAPIVHPTIALPADAFYKQFWSRSVPVDQKLTVYVVELLSFKPYPAEDLLSERFPVANRLREVEETDMIRSWFKVEQLASRLGFVPKEPFKSPS